MIVSDLINKLQEFPQDARVVIFPPTGWSDIANVDIVFGDYVAIMDQEPFGDIEEIEEPRCEECDILRQKLAQREREIKVLKERLKYKTASDIQYAKDDDDVFLILKMRGR